MRRLLNAERLRRPPKLSRRSAPDDPGGVIHFLHIGKTAGTQMTRLAEQMNARATGRRIIRRRHGTDLVHLPPNAAYFFSIRDPVSRFRSGFYSRKRKGQPRTYVEWSAPEAVAFRDFPHANDLAESLFEPNDRGARAAAAMRAIKHTKKLQADWFAGRPDFLDSHPPLWILRQERFEADLETFLARAGQGVRRGELEITSNAVQAHANDYDGVPGLSPRAIENLREWYARDFAFHAACEAWMARHAPRRLRWPWRR